MNIVDRDVSGAIALINDKEALYAKYSPVFLFTTENQKELNNVLHYSEKKVLMPASSGDQYLGATFYGAEKVDLFDINRLTKYMTCLKISAIRRLSYEEFFTLFLPKIDGKPNRYFLHRNIIQKLFADLPPEAAEFWDKITRLAQIYGMDGIVRKASPINIRGVVKRGMPFYSDSSLYYELQEKLRSSASAFPRFFEADVQMLGDVITDEYDIVYLSNIISCIASMDLDKCSSIREAAILKNDRECKALRKIGPHLSKVLKDDGVALMSYAGNCRKSMMTDHLFTNPYFESRTMPCKVPAVYSPNGGAETDLALIYRPKNGRFY